MSDTGGVRVVKSAARTEELLEVLAARGDRPARLQELADELGVPRSSMYALLQTLISRGWVRTDVTGSLYGIGIHALLTGTGYLDSDPRVRLVRPYLDEASQALGMTAIWRRVQKPDKPHKPEDVGEGPSANKQGATRAETGRALGEWSGGEGVTPDYTIWTLTELTQLPIF